MSRPFHDIRPASENFPHHSSSAYGGSQKNIRCRHILLTTDTVGGVWTYALELAREFMNHGRRVTLATMGAPLSAGQRRQSAFLSPEHMHESAFRLEWMEDPWHDLHRAGEWLLRLEEAVNPDIIHLNSFVHGMLPWRAPLVIAGHSCVLSWWRAVKGCEASPEWNRYRQAVQEGLRSADMVVAPSHWMLVALQSLYGPLSSITTIYNGRREGLFISGRKEPFLFTAGRLWDEGKNITALTRIAPSLAWPCYVAGECDAPGGSPARVASPEALHVLGHISEQELASWLARAAIYILPAKYEPFGLSAVEAALAGCALVLGDIPSLREIWGEAAFFVPPDDDQALHAALDRLIREEPLRLRLARRAQQRAQQFSSTQMARHYLLLYEALVPHTHVNNEARPCVL